MVGEDAMAKVVAVERCVNSDADSELFGEWRCWSDISGVVGSLCGLGSVV